MAIRMIGFQGAVVTVLVLRAASVGAVAPRARAVDEAIQVLADLTAIDADCRNLAVDFGVGFRFASGQGLSPAAVMPTGPKRPAFETALRLTRSGYGDAVVCGPLARHYSIALPGSVMFQQPSRGDGS